MFEDKELNEIISKVEDSHWWYKARLKIVGKLLEKYCRPGMKLLNIGSGTGGSSLYISRFAETVNVDLSKHALRLSRNKSPAPGICAPAEKLPFRDGSFDLVLCLDVLEHIPGQAEAGGKCTVY